MPVIEPKPITIDGVTYVGATPLSMPMWLQFCYEVSYGTNESAVEFTRSVCASFINIVREHGEDIARKLFEMPSGILPSELPAAAQHLHDGGNIEMVASMARNGEFAPLAERQGDSAQPTDHAMEQTHG